MTRPTREAERAWNAAATAAALLAVDPKGLKGIRIFAGHGPVREHWLDLVRTLLPGPVLRVGAQAPDEAWFGGLDLAETLTTGRRHQTRGIVERADGGLIVLTGAEAMPAGIAAQLARVAEYGFVIGAADHADGAPVEVEVGYILFDEGNPADGRPPTALEECSAFAVDLDHVSFGDLTQSLWTRSAIAQARRLLPAVTAGRADVAALARTGNRLGVGGVRAIILALNAARAAAALDGRTSIKEDDLAIAAGLVLAPRATRLPDMDDDDDAQRSSSDAEEPVPSPRELDAAALPDDGGQEDLDELRAPTSPEMEEIVLEAAVAAIPRQLLSQLALTGTAVRSSTGGRSGAARRSNRRGRPLAARRGRPSGHAPLDVMATLFAAAPWSNFRRSALGLRRFDPASANKDAPSLDRLIVLPSDFRIKRFTERAQSLAVFVVDASGSMALQRLAEAKGAVELMLADAYSRRDQVALVVCSGRGAQLVVPPTRSLTRVRRLLGGLAGGGPTPLAGALDVARGLCVTAVRHQQTPIIVLLTDGRANVSRDGRIDRTAAFEDALSAARELANRSAAAIVIDSASRAGPNARELAAALDATYLALPHAEATRVCEAVRATHRDVERAQ
ncbi:MAG: magnesium chelatase subunit D [Rhizobiales bacterium]|nr:magnesium chelatase subunit D [Hyphomicrobiales bacterium]